jgi:hypothetical protein
VAPWPFNAAFGEPLQTPKLDRSCAVSKQDPARAIPSFYKGSASVRKGRYRIIRYGGSSHQLFDCIADYWWHRDLGTAHPAFAGMQATHSAEATVCGFDISRIEPAGGPEDSDGDSNAALPGEESRDADG